MSAILAIEINLTLDMYVTASSDGTLALRCLRTSSLWKIIQNKQLLNKKTTVVSLKLSLHGYIALILKTKDYITELYIYSINGELLHSSAQDRSEIKFVFMTQKENYLIFATNMKKGTVNMGLLRVVKLFNCQKVQDLD